MGEFLIQSPFADGDEMVLQGIVQSGTVYIGTRLKLIGVEAAVISIEQFNKKISSASQGMNVGLRIKRVKDAEHLSDKIVEF
ncbi:hypothetical protein COS83_03030 [archaeon CG07_land_8_20_14_0_80_38_8]|nr:MAG: hypothetical protein COS83_03030 [archaeon CG07_land_8_20_14_0_80_38_8]PIU89075.1 MAG: hypothetical protein COS64_01860 [archaeon CG06_land_8_20_14_3_00_37_11]